MISQSSISIYIVAKHQDDDTPNNQIKALLNKVTLSMHAIAPLVMAVPSEYVNSDFICFCINENSEVFLCGAIFVCVPNQHNNEVMVSVVRRHWCFWYISKMLSAHSPPPTPKVKKRTMTEVSWFLLQGCNIPPHNMQSYILSSCHLELRHTQTQWTRICNVSNEWIPQHELCLLC